MQRFKEFWLAAVLAAVASMSGSMVAWSQQVQPYYPGDSPYSAMSAISFDEGASLDDRVADLEAALKKMKDKEAAAKKKAAGKPSVSVGGRIYADWYAYDQGVNSIFQIGDQQNGFRFDTVRIFVKGSAFHVMDYKVQFDFAGTQSATTGAAGAHDHGGAVAVEPAHTHAGGTLQAATFKDVYITVKELPFLGHVKVGHYKEPFSLDQLTSSRYVTFMERSLADTFVPARNVGIMAYDTAADDNMTWGIGAFISENGDEPPVFRNDNGGTAVTSRVTWTPWYDEATEGRGLFHLGVDYSFRDIADGTARFRSRPEADLGSYVVDTGNIAATSDVQLLGLEAAFVYGPFRVQSEYMRSFVSRAGFADPEFDGVYVQASYFLTGEQRKYNRSNGSFDNRVKPYENFFRVRDCDGYIQMGKGAWELAYRVSYLDLNSAGITGGDVTDHTVGLNWYLNPYSRLVLNYINSDLRRFGVAGNMHIFATRFQIDF